MKIAILALTFQGVKLAKKLGALIKDNNVDFFLSEKFNDEKIEVESYFNSLRELVQEIFFKYDAFIFIMATGIVVRIIAPYINDKRTDPAVVVIDEMGRNVISLLSGHLGGANALTEEIAQKIGANPVITTATDVQGRPAFDLLAKRISARILPFKNLKYANAALVNNKDLIIFTDYHFLGLLDNYDDIRLISIDNLSRAKVEKMINNISKDSFPVVISNKLFKVKQAFLQLVPQNIIVGVGSRRGVSHSQVKNAVDFALNKLNLRLESIKKIATIDLKADETGIKDFAEKIKAPINIISREKIKKSDISFTESEFVKKTIGVGGVCEPAAILSSRKGELILKKTAVDRVTVAVVEERYDNDKEN